MFLGSNMHVMMQALKEGTGSCLPHRLSIRNTYTEKATGNKRIVVLVKNLTTAPITITKGLNIAQVIAVNAIPQVGVTPGTVEKLNEMQGIQKVNMSVEQRKEALFQQLHLSGLEGCSSQYQATTHTLLAEYHDIFSLEPGELGCIDTGKT